MMNVTKLHKGRKTGIMAVKIKIKPVIMAHARRDCVKSGPIDWGLESCWTRSTPRYGHGPRRISRDTVVLIVAGGTVE